MEYDEADFGYDPYDGDDLMAFRDRELDEDAAAGEFSFDAEDALLDMEMEDRISGLGDFE
jgi:hypothetical protein